MTAVPARVAGVAEIYICTPPGPQGKVSPYVLAAAAEVGATRVFRVGGAQAVAAMTYGTGSIPAVQKICGPGNLYVTLAKKLVYGQVGIDMLAGPSEVLIIAGEKASPAFVAADILAQGEHGPTSACYVVCFSQEQLAEIFGELKKQLVALPRRQVAEQALQKGRAVLVENVDQAFAVANRIAPEHLQVFSGRTLGEPSQDKKCRCHLPGGIYPCSGGGLLGGAQPCAAHRGGCPFFFPFGGGRFPEEVQHSLFSARLPGQSQGKYRAAGGGGRVQCPCPRPAHPGGKEL
jgi:histidinol dehydrogenase